jgi:hypothetical protein
VEEEEGNGTAAGGGVCVGGVGGAGVMVRMCGVYRVNIMLTFFPVYRMFVSPYFSPC